MRYHVACYTCDKTHSYEDKLWAFLYWFRHMWKMHDVWHWRSER